MKHIIEFADVSKHYGGFSLQNVTFFLPEAGTSVILGEPQSGKTAIAKLIIGMERQNSGSVKVLGMDSSKYIKDIRRRVGYISGDTNYYEDKTVFWNAKFISQFYSTWNTEDFVQIIKKFRINPRAKMSEISEGSKLLFSVMIALSYEADIIIYDEPEGVERSIRKMIMDSLFKYSRDKRKSVVILARTIGEYQKEIDNVIYLADGSVELYGAKDNILTSWKRIHFKNVDTAGNYINELINVSPTSFGITGITSNFQKIKPSISDGITEGEIKIEDFTLDTLTSIFGKENQE